MMIARQTILATVAALLLAVAGSGLRVLVLTPAPVMHCDNCENKIKGNLRFEKGIVKIETDRDKQTVTVTYNPEKTSPEAIQAAMKKIGRETTVVSDNPVEKGTKKGKDGKK